MVEVQVYKALGIAKDRVQISQELNLVFACYRPLGAKRTKSSSCGSSLQDFCPALLLYSLYITPRGFFSVEVVIQQFGCGIFPLDVSLVLVKLEQRYCNCSMFS